MNNHRSAQAPLRRLAFPLASLLSIVSLLTIAAFWGGPAFVAPAAFAGGILLLLAFFVQEFRPPQPFTYRARETRSGQRAPMLVKPEGAPVREATRRRTPTRRPRMAKVVG